MRGLTRSVPTAVFREVEEILRGDDTLKKVVDTWKTYGDHDRKSPVGAKRQGLEVRLFPFIQGQQPESADSHTLQLQTQADLIFPTTDAGDWLDVWLAIQRALYPDTFADRQAIQARLREKGAHTGECLFLPPRPNPQLAGESGFLALSGQIVLQVRWMLNP
jgi:hypothetical protein